MLLSKSDFPAESMFAISGVVYVKIDRPYLTLRYIATIRENKFTLSAINWYIFSYLGQKKSLKDLFGQ